MAMSREWRKYLANSGWMLSEKLVGMVFGLLTVIVLARYLGPDEFGYYSYALSLVMLLAVICHLGMPTLVVKELRVNKEREDEVLSTVWTIKCVAAAVSYLSLMLVAFKGQDEAPAVLLIMGLSLFFTPFETIVFWFQASVNAKPVAIANTVGNLIGNILKVVMAVLGAGLVFIASAQVVIGFISFGLVGAVFYRLKKDLRFQFSWATAKELMSKSFLIFLGSISAVIYLKVDQVMLKHMLDDYAVGQYAAAAKISEAIYFLPAVLLLSIFPKIIDLKKESQARYAAMLQLIFDGLFIFSFVFSVVVYMFSDQIVLLLYGTQYSLAAEILSLHVFAAIFVFMRALFSKWIVIEEVYIFSLVTQGLGAISNVILNYLLIPKYGAIGAAYATLLAYSMAGYLALFFSAKTRVIFYMMSKSMMFNFIRSYPEFIKMRVK